MTTAVNNVLINYIRTAGEISAGVTPSNYSYPGAIQWECSIQRFGAICDGVTDDQAAFQAAVDSIPATGGTIYVPANTLLGSQVLIEDKIGITIKIERGANITFTDGSYVGFLFSGGQSHKITGGRIFGSNRTSTTAITLIKVGEAGSGNQCPLFLMEDCTLAFASTCIEIANSYECTLRGNNYSNAYCFVNYTALGSSTAIFNIGETYGFANWGNNTNYNVKVKANCVVFDGCYWENIGQNQNALLVVTGAQGCRITGGSISNSGGIHVETSNDLTMTGVRVDNSYDATNLRFLRMAGGNTLEMTGCTLTNNSVPTNVIGISASSASVIISGNQFNKWATAISSSSSGPIIGNSILNCTLGINAGSGSTHIIDGNYVTANTTGIQLVNGSSIAAKNYYTGNTTNITVTGSTNVAQEPDYGATASVADGGTITHGHCKTPTSARAVCSVSGEMASVTAIGATTITVAIKKHDGTAGTTQTIYWDVTG